MNGDIGLSSSSATTAGGWGGLRSIDASDSNATSRASSRTGIAAGVVRSASPSPSFQAICAWREISTVFASSSSSEKPANGTGVQPAIRSLPTTILPRVRIVDEALAAGSPDALRDEGGPTGLMARAETSARVTVEILVKQDEVAEVGIAGPAGVRTVTR